MQFPDGQLPSKDLIKKWLATVDEFFSNDHPDKNSSILEKKDDKNSNNNPVGGQIDPIKLSNASAGGPVALEKRNQPISKSDEIKRIGVHCVAGLGRAPFFVAIALVNNGCSPQNAIDLIRNKRPGAFNLAQAYYILEFEGKSKGGKGSGGSSNATCKCQIF